MRKHIKIMYFIAWRFAIFRNKGEEVNNFTLNNINVTNCFALMNKGDKEIFE